MKVRGVNGLDKVLRLLAALHWYDSVKKNFIKYSNTCTSLWNYLTFMASQVVGTRDNIIELGYRCKTYMPFLFTDIWENDPTKGSNEISKT